jgi:hypothetical protein
MTFYHLTWAENADAIMKHGFRDSTIHDKTGVWFSRSPIRNYNDRERGHADTLLSVKMPDDVADLYEVNSYSDAEKAFLTANIPSALDSPTSEYCVPADVANLYRSTLLQEPSPKRELKE